MGRSEITKGAIMEDPAVFPVGRRLPNTERRHWPSMYSFLNERLFQFYGQINFDAIRRRATQQNEISEHEDECVSLSCQDLSNKDGDAVSSKKTTDPADVRHSRLRPLRLDELLDILVKQFDCEVRQGKGSEINVYHPNEKIYRFGHHREVHPILLKRVLNRLEITPQDWLRVVYE
jgi:hypothetical protein